MVRTAQYKDANDLGVLCGELGCAVAEAAMQERLRKALQSATDTILVATSSEDRVIGWIHAHAIHVLISGFRVEIVGLAVSSSNRRRGVARKLVESVEAWAKNLGAPEIVVRSNIARTESHAFYPAIGYAQTKVQRVYRKILTRP